MDRIERYDPARPDELVGSVAVTTPDEVAAVVGRAEAAFGPWSASPFEDRAAALLRAADAVAGLASSGAAELLCRELGKVLVDCHGEIGFSAAYLRDAVARARTVLDAPVSVDDDAGRMDVVLEPYGPVAAITPWNAPIILTMLKVGPALATGNTLVVKPSPLAPLAITQVIEAIAAHLPDGVLDVVHGGAETGRALTGDARIRKVAFTGGLGTGAAIARNVADQVKPLVLELGGNDAAIILDDADLDDAAIDRLIQASFITSGQVCMAAKRVYVHRSRLDEVVARYQQVAQDSLVMGDPMAAGVTLGPLVTEEARDRVAGLLAQAGAGGCEVVALGTVAHPDLVARGWFLRPTLVLGADDADPIMAEEQFGPVVPIVAFDDTDEVVARANASELGLGASVWSADEARAFELARRLEVGFAFINTHNRSGMSLRAPFGGRKLSGYGREYADAGIREYLQTKTINAPAAFRPGSNAPTAGAGYPGA